MDKDGIDSSDLNWNVSGHVQHAYREMGQIFPNCLLLSENGCLPANTEILDFRATECWNSRPTNFLPRNFSNKDISRWNPPDEFDWFSYDKIGKIITMNEAAELFTILNERKCTLTLKELMLNATRPDYWSCPHHRMPLISDTLLQMNLLTKLILRGMADNDMLKLIGEAATGLKHLDVSFSKFVTDQGVQNLFFPADMKENVSALGLIPSWIVKNLYKMCPLVNTLTYLDFSWTNITSLSRKMINAMPGCYLFKRFFAPSENEAHGHHIFVRKTPEMSMTIRLKDVENDFEAKLQTFAGKNGSDHFLKFVETHPWRNYNMTIYSEPDQSTTINENLGENDTSLKYVGLITPSKEDKRITGLIVCESENLIELYSINPINLNQVGLACPNLQTLRGVVTDEWKQSSFLSNLTHVELFCEPSTACSILTTCPNLKIVKIRILKKILDDKSFIEAITSSQCRKTLEELWIAPGSFKKCGGFNSEKNSSSEARVEFPMNLGTKSFHSGIANESKLSEKDERIEDLVHLSVFCARAIIIECQNLRRLGSLSWWWITEEQLEFLCTEIQERNSELRLLWENLVIPILCSL